MELQKYISEFLISEYKLDELVTVTGVNLYGDGSKATIFLSFFNTERIGEIIEELNKAQGLARKFLVKKKLNWRRIPQIYFQIDPNAKY